MHSLFNSIEPQQRTKLYVSRAVGQEVVLLCRLAS